MRDLLRCAGYGDDEGFAVLLEGEATAWADDDLLDDVQVVGQRGQLEGRVLEVEGCVFGAAVLDVERCLLGHVGVRSGAFETARLKGDGAGVCAVVEGLYLFLCRSPRSGGIQ